MKTPTHTLTTLWLFTSLLTLTAQEARFFRVVGPVPTTIIAISVNGNVTWTNAPTNATFTVQTTTAGLSGSNWVDWTQVTVTNPITTVRVFDINPPPRMVLIPAGSFTMGDNLDGSLDALPLHTNYVAAFYMDRYETTRVQWDEVYQWATNHGYTFVALAPAAKGTNHPVQTVNWYNRVKWCNARSEMEGLSPCYYTTADQTNVLRTGTFVLSNACVKWTANGYRLPTEAEWEKAARGGANGQRFPWGDTIAHSQANYYAAPASYAFDVSVTSGYNPLFDENGTPYTNPAGYFAPNAFGLYDMAGNVWEWCWDSYGVYSSATQIDPHGPETVFAAGGVPIARVLRGGGWGADATYSRCADRASGSPGNAGNTAGARCVRAF